MNDTVDLLEYIGSDASLRHASMKDLARALECLQAEEVLKRSAASGNAERLRIELGAVQTVLVHSPPPGPTPPPEKRSVLIVPPPPPID